MKKGYFESRLLGNASFVTNIAKSMPCFYKSFRLSSRAMIEILLLLCFENHFLHLHLVEKIVTFYSLGHGHDLVRHEAQKMLLLL